MTTGGSYLSLFVPAKHTLLRRLRGRVGGRHCCPGEVAAVDAFRSLSRGCRHKPNKGGLGNLAREFGVIDRQFVRNELV